MRIPIRRRRSGERRALAAARDPLLQERDRRRRARTRGRECQRAIARCARGSIVRAAGEQRAGAREPAPQARHGASSSGARSARSPWRGVHAQASLAELARAVRASFADNGGRRPARMRCCCSCSRCCARHAISWSQLSMTRCTAAKRPAPRDRRSRRPLSSMCSSPSLAYSPSRVVAQRHEHLRRARLAEARRASGSGTRPARRRRRGRRGRSGRPGRPGSRARSPTAAREIRAPASHELNSP